MQVKIDTKEKFHVITINETELPAIMTEELRDMLTPYLQKDIPHIVLNLSAVTSMDDQSCGILTDLQNFFYGRLNFTNNKRCILLIVILLDIN